MLDDCKRAFAEFGIVYVGLRESVSRKYEVFWIAAYFGQLLVFSFGEQKFGSYFFFSPGESLLNCGDLNPLIVLL